MYFVDELHDFINLQRNKTELSVPNVIIMNFLEVGLSILSISFGLFVVCLVVCLGWILVWKLFLSRFKLVRELWSGGNDNQTVAADSNKDSNSKITKTKKTRRE